MIQVRITLWGCLKMITHQNKSVSLVLKPRNWPIKSKYSKETTVIVVKNKFRINRYTSKNLLTRRDRVYLHFSKLSNHPLYPQISVDVGVKSVVLNITVALTCILLFYKCNLHVYWSLHFDTRLFTVFTASLYTNKGFYIENGERQACQ